MAIHVITSFLRPSGRGFKLMEITRDKLKELMLKAFMTGKKTYLADKPTAEFWVEEMISPYAEEANK